MARPRDTLAETKRKLGIKTDLLSRERGRTRELAAALEKAQRRIERAERVLKARREQRRAIQGYETAGEIKRAQRAERQAETDLQEAKDTAADLKVRADQADREAVQQLSDAIKPIVEPAPQPKPAAPPDEKHQEKRHERSPFDRIRRPLPWQR